MRKTRTSVKEVDLLILGEIEGEGEAGVDADVEATLGAMLEAGMSSTGTQEAHTGIPNQIMAQEAVMGTRNGVEVHEVVMAMGNLVVVREVVVGMVMQMGTHSPMAAQEAAISLEEEVDINGTWPKDSLSINSSSNLPRSQ